MEILRFIILLKLIGGMVECCDVDGGYMAFRPADPQLIRGVSTEVCCGLKIDNETVGDWYWPPTAIEFYCNSNMDKIYTATSVNNHSHLTSTEVQNKMCVNITLDKSSFCLCKVKDRPLCTESQYATVNEPLPKNLTFNCVTHLDARTTCKLNLPQFADPNKVNSTIRWMKKDGEIATQPCSHYSICSLSVKVQETRVFNLSIITTYDLCAGVPFCNNDKVSRVVSDWVTHDTQTNLVFEPINFHSITKESRMMRIEWKIPHIVHNVTVDVSYTAEGIKRNKKMTTISLNSYASMVLSDLRPFTMYSLCIRGKIVESSLWTNWTCENAKTKPSAPEKSPLTSLDAFVVLDDWNFMVYWKQLPEKSWNSALEGRKYIIQKYDNVWKDVVELNWKDVQTTLSSRKGHRWAIVSANDEGRAEKRSMISLPGLNSLLQLTNEVIVEYDIQSEMVTMSWDATPEYDAIAYWCEQGPQDYTCLDSFHWTKQASKGSKSIIVDMANYTVRQNQFGVSLSLTNQQDVITRSGINWTSCVRMIDGSSSSLKGNCRTHEVSFIESSTELATWEIILIVVGTIIVIVIVISCYIKMRFKKLHKSNEKFNFGEIISSDNGMIKEFSDNSWLGDGYSRVTRVSVCEEVPELGGWSHTHGMDNTNHKDPKGGKIDHETGICTITGSDDSGMNSNNTDQFDISGGGGSGDCMIENDEKGNVVFGVNGWGISDGKGDSVIIGDVVNNNKADVVGDLVEVLTTNISNDINTNTGSKIVNGVDGFIKKGDIVNINADIGSVIEGGLFRKDKIASDRTFQQDTGDGVKEEEESKPKLGTGNIVFKDIEVDLEAYNNLAFCDDFNTKGGIVNINAGKGSVIYDGLCEEESKPKLGTGNIVLNNTEVESDSDDYSDTSFNFCSSSQTDMDCSC